ncbi:c-type cytochrome [Muricoccus vinaceus]|uniref:C-type cytochrome n=1 Tax=Muricoccus vinaceus TaxID=424704 RepID=A0ABV6IY91_9PROT
MMLAGGLALALALPASGTLAADAARGAALAEERNCGACHGARGVSAIENIPSLAGQQPEFIALQLVLFREGLRDVPPMEAPSSGLTDEQVEDLAGHFASLPHAPPEDRAPRNAEAFARGEALAGPLRCGICHRADLSGQNQVPHIAAQREDFLAESLRAYRDDKRRGSDTQMNGVVQGLSDADIAALAHYVAQR